jgi:hypothetical protein
MKGFALGVALGIGLGAYGVAVAQQGRSFESDRYQMGWTVLSRGVVICQDPFVRPTEREIECRSGR